MTADDADVKFFRCLRGKRLGTGRGEVLVPRACGELRSSIGSSCLWSDVGWATSSLPSTFRRQFPRPRNEARARRPHGRSGRRPWTCGLADLSRGASRRRRTAWSFEPLSRALGACPVQSNQKSEKSASEFSPRLRTPCRLHRRTRVAGDCWPYRRLPLSSFQRSRRFLRF